jgi:hypothetical protein
LDPKPADAVHPVLSWHNKRLNVFAVNLFNDAVSNREEQRLTALVNRMLRRRLGLKLFEAGKKAHN